MPPFRIHNPKIRSNRVLIRTVKGQTVVVPYSAVSTDPIVTLPVKPKKKISMSQIKQVIQLLQQSKNKNLSALLAGGAADDEDVEIDELSESGSEVEIEDVDDIEEGEKEEVLIIDL
jgi:Ser-tRNA(Ala) deacylase AlaX